jgi:hypothetical protein
MALVARSDLVSRGELAAASLILRGIEAGYVRLNLSEVALTVETALERRGRRPARLIWRDEEEPDYDLQREDDARSELNDALAERHSEFC